MSTEGRKVKVFPNFEKPPVGEVVCGVFFEPIEGLKAPYMGLFWQKLRDQFPTCEHAAPLGDVAKIFDSATGVPLPRIWLVSAKGNELLQLQKDLFLFNWRKLQEEEEYPRYHSVIDSFKASYAIFEKFIEEEGLGSLIFTRCELTYVNQIPKGEGWESAAQIGLVMPDLAWRSGITRSILPDPSALGWQAVFDLPDKKGQLSVKVSQALFKISREPVIRLEINARGLGADKSIESIWEWFDLAHEWIVWGFVDLTSAEVQKEAWLRKGDSQQP